MMFSHEKMNGNRVLRLECTAAQLAMWVKNSGGELRMWQAVGGVAFIWVDRAGHVIGGWEEDSYNRRASCIVYYGGPSDPKYLPPRRAQNTCGYFAS